MRRSAISSAPTRGVVFADTRWVGTLVALLISLTMFGIFAFLRWHNLRQDAEALQMQRWLDELARDKEGSINLAEFEDALHHGSTAGRPALLRIRDASGGLRVEAWADGSSGARPFGQPGPTSLNAIRVERSWRLGAGRGAVWTVEAFNPATPTGEFAIWLFVWVLCATCGSAVLWVVLRIAWNKEQLVIEPLGRARRLVRTRELVEWRAPVRSAGRFRLLVDSFNALLAEIQRRDEELVKIRQELERRVDLRTADLELALNRVELTAKFVRDRENLLRSVLDTAPDGIIICDASGQIQHLNRAAGVLFGRSVLNIRGTAMSELLDTRSSFEEGAARVDIDFSELDRMITPVRWRMIGRKPDGTQFPVDIAVSDAQVEAQRLFTWLVRDVSAEVAAEKERQLAAEVRARAERAAGMAETAAGVLHNIGNILNSVTTSVTLLRSRVDSPIAATLDHVQKFVHDKKEADGSLLASTPGVKNLPVVLERLSSQWFLELEHWKSELDRLRGNVDHIGQVISSHQSAARGQFGALRRRMTLRRLIHSALEFRRGQVGADWISVHWDSDPDTEVALDEHKVLQILGNLIKNACESVQTQAPPSPRVEIRAAVDDNETLIISVEDNGVGVAPEKLAQVFRLGFTTKREGHGFGLHNSANAATEMGGSLELSSPGVGLGATFSLRLPVEHRTLAEDAKEQDHAAA